MATLIKRRSEAISISRMTFYGAIWNTWGETAAVVAVGAMAMLVMTLPAYHLYFLGEDFIYLHQFQSTGSYISAVLSPTAGIFFRPVFCAVNLLWMFVLPTDPFFHHLRNYVFSVFNFVLLYRLLLHYVASRPARIISFFFFDFSKIHFTTIGYINVYDSIVSLMLLLLTAIFFRRFATQRRGVDYSLALVFCFLSIFTKDYGLVVIGVVLALVAASIWQSYDRRAQIRFWFKRLWPLPLMAVIYFSIRYAIVGPLPTNNSVYSPEISIGIIGQKVLIFSSTLMNLSMSRLGTTGGGGLSDWAAPHLIHRLPFLLSPMMIAPVDLESNLLDVLLYIAGIILFAATLARTKHKWIAALFPVIWIGAYFGPTLLTRNIQMYYMYEPLAGAAFLVGVLLDGASRRWYAAWAVALVLLGINGALADAHSNFDWSFSENLTARIEKPVVDALQGQQVTSLTFVTNNPSFWSWALSADGESSMIPVLLHQPGVAVRFIEYKDLPAYIRKANKSNLLFDVDNGMIQYDPGKVYPPLILDSISPSPISIGPSGDVRTQADIPIGVQTKNATPATMVVMDGKRLQTTVASPSFVTASVPLELAIPGLEHKVYLTNGIENSNTIEIQIIDKSQTGSGASTDQANEATPKSARIEGLDVQRFVPGSPNS